MITIDAHDPDGICKIELWVNGAVQDEDYVSREDDGGYRDILFDTNDLPDGQTEIFVRVCDCDGNCINDFDGDGDCEIGIPSSWDEDGDGQFDDSDLFQYQQ